MLLAIDPGRDTGWAVLRDARLIACGLGRPAGPWLPSVTRLAIEHPCVYPGGRTRDPNAIVRLAINAGEHAGRFDGLPITWVFPRAWKGTIDPDIVCARVRARLIDDEREGVLAPVERALRAKSKIHNVLDAIGIGLHVIGR